MLYYILRRVGHVCTFVRLSLLETTLYDQTAYYTSMHLCPISIIFLSFFSTSFVVKVRSIYFILCGTTSLVAMKGSHLSNNVTARTCARFFRPCTKYTRPSSYYIFRDLICKIDSAHTPSSSWLVLFGLQTCKVMMKLFTQSPFLLYTNNGHSLLLSMAGQL